MPRNSLANPPTRKSRKTRGVRGSNGDPPLKRGFSFDALYRELVEARKPKPNYERGWTVNEWSNAWGKRPGSRSMVVEHLRAAVEGGDWVEDKDIRVLRNGAVRPVTVYRPVKKTKCWRGQEPPGVSQ